MGRSEEGEVEKSVNGFGPVMNSILERFRLRCDQGSYDFSEETLKRMSRYYYHLYGPIHTHEGFEKIIGHFLETERTKRVADGRFLETERTAHPPSGLGNSNYRPS